MVKLKKIFKVNRSIIQGRGLFALEDIPKGTKIVEYTGDKVTKSESQKRSEKRRKGSAIFIFELNSRYDLDGNIAGNLAKYINHSCDPNCETQNIRGKIWILSRRDIKKGDELTYDYGFDMHSFFEHPCACNTDKCIGYIVREDLRSKVKRLLKNSQKTKKSKKSILLN